MRNAKGEGSLWPTDNGYRGYVTVNGMRKYFSARTKAEAAQKRRQLLTQRDTTGLATGKSQSLGSWIEHWLKITETIHSPNVVSNYPKLVARYVPKSLLALPLSKVTVSRLETLYADLEAKGLAASTRGQVHSILHTSLKLAAQRGMIPTNPASQVQNKPRPKRDRTDVEEYVFSDADVVAIKSALESSRLKARWHLALGLAMRPAEALGLEWSHINFEARTIKVRQQVQSIDGKLVIRPLLKTASGRRDIPMPEYIAVMLMEHRIEQLETVAGAGVEMWSPDGKPHSWVFTSARRPGRPLTADGDGTEWRKILIAAGVPHKRRYSARHTAISWLLANGVDLVTVAEIVGHSDPSLTLRVYAHSVEERKLAAAHILDTANNKVQDKVQQQSVSTP